MPKSEMIFKTPYGDHKRGVIPSGSGKMPEYKYTRDSYGRKVLEKTGERDLYAEIQAEYEATKIENILSRAIAGDVSGLSAVGDYYDTTSMPNNLIDAMAQIQKLENLWLNLPMEIKNKYNNSVEEFIGASGSKEWCEDMGLVAPEKAPELKTPEVAGAYGEAKGAVAEGAINES